MVSVEQLIYFLIASTLLIIIPGPNVLVIISTSLSHGRTRGLQTVAGTSSAMAIQLCIAAFSTAGVVTILSQGFSLIKWLGVVYLLYLGLAHFYRLLKPQQSPAVIGASGTFIRGFIVSLTNPKTIVFFAAFLPQFVVGEENYLQQIAILSIAFLCLAAILDSAFVLLANLAKSFLSGRRFESVSNSLSALIYLSASYLLAITNRTH